MVRAFETAVFRLFETSVTLFCKALIKYTSLSRVPDHNNNEINFFVCNFQRQKARDSSYQSHAQSCNKRQFKIHSQTKLDAIYMHLPLIVGCTSGKIIISATTWENACAGDESPDQSAHAQTDLGLRYPLAKSGHSFPLAESKDVVDNLNKQRRSWSEGAEE